MGAFCSPGRPAARLLTYSLDQSLCSSPATASPTPLSLSETTPTTSYLLPSCSHLLAPRSARPIPRVTRSLVFTRTRRASSTPRPSDKPTLPNPTCYSLRLSVFIKTVTRVFPCSALVASPAVDVLNSSLALRRPLFLSPSPFLARTLLLSTCSV